MIIPLAENLQCQTELIAAVSHEMRTPLAAVQTGSATLKIASDPEEKNRFMTISEKESMRSTRLIDDLLTLASLDAKGWSITKEPVEIHQLLEYAFAYFDSVAIQKCIQMELPLPHAPLPLLIADANRMRQVLDIILDNALRYTPRNGRIKLSAQMIAHQVHVLVADDGPGMTNDQKGVSCSPSNVTVTGVKGYVVSSV